MKAIISFLRVTWFAWIAASMFMLGGAVASCRLEQEYGERPDFKLGLEVGEMLAQPVSRIEMKPGAVIRGVIFESPIQITRGIQATIEDCEWPAVGNDGFADFQDCRQFMIRGCSIHCYDDGKYRGPLL